MSKISLNPLATPLIGNELIPITQEGENRNTTPEQLLANVNILLAQKASKIVQVPDVLIPSLGWNFVTGLYEYEIENENILSSSLVIVVPSNIGIDVVRAANVYPQVNSSDGSLKLYAKNHPTADFFVTLNII